MSSIIESLESRRLLAFVGADINVANTDAEEGTYSIAFDGTNFLVGLEKDHLIGAQLVSSTGKRVGSFISTKRFGNHSAASFGGQPLIAFGGGKYLMIWGDSAAATHDIWGVFITTGGALGGKPFAISKGSSEEQTAGVAFDGSRFLVTYLKNAQSGSNDTAVAGRFVSPAGSVGSEIAISTGAGDQVLNNVAYDGKKYLVVWTDDTNDSDVRGRFVSKIGSLGTEFSINNSAEASNTPCTVGFDGTNYLVAYTDQTGPNVSDVDVFAQRISTTGAKLGAPITIAANPGRQLVPYVAFDGNNWMVTFTSFRKDLDNDFVNDQPLEGSFVDIFGVLLNRNGESLGQQFVVTSDAGFQLGGAAAFGKGRYIVAWNDGVTLDQQSGQFIFTDVVAAAITPIPSATLASGKLVVKGTVRDDKITLSIESGKLRVNESNGFKQDFTLASVTSITIGSGDGNDTVTILPGVMAAAVSGGSGNDTVTGGNGNDTITGGSGTDSLRGGNGADSFIANDSAADKVFGEGGSDSATADASDILDSIEHPNVV